MPRKGENIYKRKDGRWEARYIKQRTSEGKAIYGYIYAKSYKEVKSKLQTHRILEANRATPQAMQTDRKASPVLFRDIAYNWQVSISPQVKESTSNKYSNLLNLYIIPNLGHFPVESLSYDVIDECANQLLASGGRNGVGLSPKTVSDILSVVRNILKYASRNGISIVCDVGAIQVTGTIVITSPHENVIATCYLDYICVDEMGTLLSPNYVSSAFSKLLEKHGLRHIRFHDLRHSCASLLLANGVPMKQIQEWLGHSDFSTTANIYAHLDYSSKLSSAEAMVNGLGNALESLR